MAEPNRPQMTICRMPTVCRITKATNAHTEYVIIISSFPLQKWLQERTRMFRYGTLPSGIKIDQLMSLALFFAAQHVYECWYIHLQELVTVCGYTAVVRCVLVLRCGSAGVVWYPYAG